MNTNSEQLAKLQAGVPGIYDFSLDGDAREEREKFHSLAKHAISIADDKGYDYWPHTDSTHAERYYDSVVVKADLIEDN